MNSLEKQVLEVSHKFWNSMENADEKGMRLCAKEECQFVHIGITCDLDKEIEFYTKGIFKPTSITFHNQNVSIFNHTAIILTDCDYALLLNGKETSHHFVVTEVFILEDVWKLVQFSFTALVY